MARKLEMTREEAAKWAELFQAMTNGKVLQYDRSTREHPDSPDDWVDFSDIPDTIRCLPNAYRVKPEPITATMYKFGYPNELAMVKVPDEIAKAPLNAMFRVTFEPYP